MEKHVTLVAAINIGFGILGILIALIIFVTVTGGGLLSGDLRALAITGAVSSAIALFMICVSIPGIIGGIGLLSYRPWARILMLIIGVLDLLQVPFGTILGIYTLWVLLKDETIHLFNAHQQV